MELPRTWVKKRELLNVQKLVRVFKSNYSDLNRKTWAFGCAKINASFLVKLSEIWLHFKITKGTSQKMSNMKIENQINDCKKYKFSS